MLTPPRSEASATTSVARAASDDYLDFCEGVRRACGIDLAQYKRGQMERRVRTFVGRRGAPDLAAYLKTLRADPDELASFLDRVTINVSQLWRNPEQWTALERVVLPELGAQSRRLRAWSAGCSYGAEAFTLAALARQVLPQASVQITGTDIDARIVARARTGRFDVQDARDAPKSMLRRFFTQEDDGTWTAGEDLRKLVRFEQGDLLRLGRRQEAYDLVLCRNTVIYFNEDVRDALHARLAASLRPGGYLVVGATERIADPAALGLSGPLPFTYRKDA